ncbi:MAG: ACP S-malonyltransferase [Candidatus Nanopelagicales bacterium]|nr:ACP S-malonyltransferase [Candidatus Nanopelagicales bacterium]
MLAIVAPGQGAQTPGMLLPWLELPGTPALLDSLASAARVDLVAHGTTSDAETIVDTAIAQPLIVASGLLAWTALGCPAADVLAGHSVGEVTAAVLAGVLEQTAAMEFVHVRGAGMAASAAGLATGMSAVLGGDATVVIAKAEEHGLTPANINAAGQIVVAGTLDQLASFAADPPEGSRVRPLSVAGAFHTVHMAPAVGALEVLASTMSTSNPTTTLLSNADGGSVETGAEVLARLVVQVSNPVRWDLCMDMMESIGVTGLLELAPGGTLTGMAKRAMPGVALLPVKGPDDLDAARAFIAEHSAATA